MFLVHLTKVKLGFLVKLVERLMITDHIDDLLLAKALLKNWCFLEVNMHEYSLIIPWINQGEWDNEDASICLSHVRISQPIGVTKTVKFFNTKCNSGDNSFSCCSILRGQQKRMLLIRFFMMLLNYLTDSFENKQELPSFRVNSNSSLFCWWDEMTYLHNTTSFFYCCLYLFLAF